MGFPRHTKYWDHPVCPLFCSFFRSSGFTLLLFEGRQGGFSHNFPEKRRDETVKTNSAFVSDSQTLLNCRSFNISKMCYHLPLLTSVVLPKLRHAFVRDWKNSLSLVPVKCEPQYLPSKVLSPAPVIFLVVAQRKEEAAAALFKCHFNKWSL